MKLNCGNKARWTKWLITAMAVMISWFNSNSAYSQTTYTWTQVGSGNWDTTTANWSVGGVGGMQFVSAPGNTAVFGNAITGAATITVAAGGVTAGTINFTNPGFGYSIAAANGTNITMDSGAGTGAAITVFSSSTAAQNFTTAGINVTDAGGIRVSNFSSTALGIGTTASTNVFNFGTGNVVFGGSGSFGVAAGAGYTMAGAGNLIMNSNGTLTLAGANTAFTGRTIINNGTLSAASMAPLGNDPGAAVANQIQLGGGTLTITGATTIGANRGITINASNGIWTGNGTINNTAAVTVNSVITGNGVFIKAGSAALTLGAAATHTGGTFISAGSLTMGAANVMPAAGAVTLTGTTSSLNLANNNQAIGALNFIMTGTNATVIQVGTATLTVNGDITAYSPGNLNTYTITSAAAGQINLGGATRNFNLSANNNASEYVFQPAITNGGINAVGSLTGAATTTNMFPGVVFLNNNTFTGPTNLFNTRVLLDRFATNSTDGRLSGTTSVAVNNSVLSLVNSTSNVNDRVNDAAPVSFASAQFLINGSGTAATPTLEVMGPLTVAGGQSTIFVTANAANVNRLTFGSLTRTNNATFDVRGSNSQNDTAANPGTNGQAYTVLTDSTNVTGANLIGGGGARGTQTISILPFASGANSGAGTAPTSFVTYNATNGFALLNTTTEFNAAITDGVVSQNNVRLTANTNVNAANTEINSLLAAGGIVNGTGTLTITSGAVLVTTAGTFGVTNLNFGAREAIITTPVATTINSFINGSNGLTKSGAATLTLGANNSTTLTGPITINQGILAVSNDNQLGANTNPVALNGGQLQLNIASLASNRTYTVGAGTVGGFDVPTGNTLTINNSIGGGGRLSKTGAGAMVLPNANAYSGGTYFTNGVLAIGNAGSLGSGPVVLSSTVSAAPAKSLRFDAPMNFTNNISHDYNTTINTNGNNVTLSGVVSSGAAAAGSNELLTKSGLGTLTFTANNPLRSSISVTQGGLAISGNGGFTLVPTITMASGTSLTLDNTGTNSLDRLPGVVAMGGAEFKLLGNAGATSRESIPQMNLTAGSNVITVTQGVGQTAVLTILNYNRTGGSVLFRGDGLGTAGQAQIFLNNIANGILLPGGLFDNTSTGNGISPAQYSTTLGVTQFNTFDLTNPTVIQNASPINVPSNANILINSPPGAIPTGSTPNNTNTISSLTFAGTNPSVNVVDSGTMTISSGILQVQAGATGAAITNGTLSFGASGASIFGNANFSISSNVTATAGGLLKIGSGNLDLTGAYSIVGPMSINGGNVNYNPAVPAVLNTAGGALSVAAGSTLNLNNNGFNIGSLGGGGTIANYGTADILINQTAATTFSGSLSGGANFLMNGSGTGNLTLAPTAPLNYTGTTTIRRGALTLVNTTLPNTALTIGDSVTVDSTGVLDLNGNNLTVPSLTIIATGASNTNRLRGAGTLTVNGDITFSSVTGSTNNDFGAFIASSVTAIDLGGAVRNFNIQGNNTGSFVGDLVFNAPIQNGGINYTGLPGSGAAAANLTLGAINTYTGSTTINRGNLRTTIANSLPAATTVIMTNATATQNATLDLQGFSQSIAGLQTSVGAISGNNVVTSATAATLTINTATNNDFGGVITGNIGLNKSGIGTQTLSGINTYAGGTQVNGGRLNVNNLTGSGTGTGAVTVGGGTLGGTGIVSGAVTVNSGVLAPGTSPGLLTLGGGITFSGGTFEVELQGTVVGTGYDQLQVTSGNISLGTGVASLSLLPSGFTPAGTDVFVVINNTGAGTLSGNFAGLPDQSIVASNVLGSGIDYAIWYGSFSGFPTSVVIAPVPEPATVLGICALGFGAANLIRRRFKKTTTAI